jgi:hypothetical protein
MTWSVTARNAWLWHSPHWMRGFSQMLRTHSFAQGAASAARASVDGSRNLTLGIEIYLDWTRKSVAPAR